MSSNEQNVTNKTSADGTRFGGLAAHVEASISASIDKHLGYMTAPFPVTAAQLSTFGGERTREAMADLLEQGVLKDSEHKDGGDEDVEMPSTRQMFAFDVRRLVDQVRQQPSGSEANKNADMMANVLTSVLLRSSPESGIDPREVGHRRQVFGTNAIADKKIDSLCKLCWEAVHDFVLIMLIVLGSISIAVEVSTHSGNCNGCWFEGAAILASVCIVVLVTAGIDYGKQFAFLRLTRSLHDTNTKQVIRDGKQVSVTDDEIVVGDILSVNAHNLASIPADCVLLGPEGDIKLNESSLTGEPELISKKPGDVILSGTEVVQGSGKMVVIAVGINSVAGKIKARVYESADQDKMDDGLGGDQEENSPLFVKLDQIAKRIGMFGSFFALLAFIGSCIIGLGVNGESPQMLIKYLITAITVLAVSVPEGLPLAVTLALAFSSNKMMSEQNLVKHLDACETMGCATTICTDKTGTLTANKMTVRALYAGKSNFLVDDPAMTLGEYVRKFGATEELMELLCRAVAINTMNESILIYSEESKQDSKKTVVSCTGNPTEVALLQMAHDMGYDYQQIRNTTKGRSDQGALGEFLVMGKRFEFSSSRKMMSWAVPLEDGGYRLFCKGASEIVLARCNKYVNKDNSKAEYDESSRSETFDVALAYARRGMRCLAIAYRDLPEGSSLDALNPTVKNSDGSDAFEAEVDMTCIALVGIEDPLRPEVPSAIEKCYTAGIDVRMVTGDNPNTAVSIAYQAGILRDFHFKEGTTERVANNLKTNVLMEGKTFRSMVYRTDGTNKEFDQAAFDKIWPHLRVLARSSPDDKLTLAHGLNQSNLFADKAVCQRLKEEHGINIFPDRQVVAMTGDGTNDAPALKRSDIAFAMGIAGTQIAKDAADIILLDDNFASIVTSAKWGRNVYAAIQKFLQFQLTVNISAVFTALVGAYAYQVSSLAAIQMLWVNLIMDSLASLALASEPPVDELLLRPPVNRTDSMITPRMWANMLGQAIYQVGTILTLLFAGPTLFDIEPGHEAENNSVHYTLIFNTFVWMQLFNEINARMLKGERNVLKGICNNTLFWSIWIGTACLQALIVQFAAGAFNVVNGGLSTEYWGLSLFLGFMSLPMQQLINTFYTLSKRYRVHRSLKRKKKAAKFVVKKINHTTDHEVESV